MDVDVSLTEALDYKIVVVEEDDIHYYNSLYVVPLDLMEVDMNWGID